MASLLGAAPPRAASTVHHAHPPIRFSQVSRPVSRTRPGKMSHSSAVVYTPANIQAAYDFGGFAAGGAGRAVAIIDAYGDPSLPSDLSAFDDQFGLPAAQVAIYTPAGAPASTNSSWAVETALDVEWAHAGAQAAQLDLIVLPDASFQHLIDGVDFAAGLPNVAAISMSWGAAETTVAADGYLPAFEDALQAAQAKGIVLLASSGDQGAYNGTHRTLQVNYPASSPEVVGVGGTTLTLSGSGGYGSETAWSGSGGGYSVEFAEPPYQTGAAIPDPNGRRGVPDVAFDADPNTGVYVAALGKWYAVGGTSVGAPNWAAVAADDAAAGSPALGLGALYGVYASSAYGADMHDVTSGSNGYYSAGVGWDAVTGAGTPNVVNLITAP
jgi:subtilase family serine protease